MPKLEIENEEIKRKKELLKNAEEILKKEFVGIDSVIENTIFNMRPWFLYPELQEKPLVISLIGLTGTGKTSLVKRLSQLLDIEKDMVYFNFAEINDMKPWEVEDTIDEQLSNEKSNRMFVYDEFQYAATLDGMGAEKDNRSGLKPFWELMDSGLIHKGAQFYDIHTIKTIISYALKMSQNVPIKIENGKWINPEECLNGFHKYDVSKFKQYFNINVSYDENGKVVKEKRYRIIEANKRNDDCDDVIPTGRLHQGECNVTPCIDEEYDDICEDKEIERTFLKEEYINMLYRLINRVKPGTDIIDFYHKFMEKDFNEIIEFLQDCIKIVAKGYDLKFNDSIIFVLMNLDEAYNMSFDVDPDMLPDQFHKMTKKLTIVDMKEALKKRFRNEQIARFGNLFMIYPSFSSESFRKLIELFLKNYSEKVYSKWNVKIEYDDTIKELLYKDAVFPTQGTRPIISSVHEIVKTKFPIIVDKVSQDGIGEADTFRLSYCNEKIVADIYLDGKKITQYEIPQELRLETHRQSENKEKQARIAVHESGHFAVYAALMGKVPEKLCSNALSKDANGFLLFDEKDYEQWSKEEIMTNIKIALGGYVAEELVFGQKKRGAGASNDLLKVTMFASEMIREYGMGSRPYVTTFLTTANTPFMHNKMYLDSQESINSEIKQIIDGCLYSVKKILNTPHWKKLMKDAAIYLSEHSSMSKEKMEELYAEVPECEKSSPDENYYRNCLNEF